MIEYTKEQLNYFKFTSFVNSELLFWNPVCSASDCSSSSEVATLNCHPINNITLMHEHQTTEAISRTRRNICLTDFLVGLAGQIIAI